MPKSLLAYRTGSFVGCIHKNQLGVLKTESVQYTPLGERREEARMSQLEGVVNMREVPEEKWEEGRFGGREQDLGRAAGSAKVGLRCEVRRRGKQSSPGGGHRGGEGMCVVVGGRGTLLRGRGTRGGGGGGR